MESSIEEKRGFCQSVFSDILCNMSVYPSAKLYLLLRIIILLLILVILGGTVFAAVKKYGRHKTAVHEEETSLTAGYTPQKDYALYGDLGQLRAVTADNPPVTVVLTPFLEYTASDTAFQEELVTKKDILKKSFLEWISFQSAYRLGSEQPQDIKHALMQYVNKELVLGQVRNIYFEEFVVLY